MCVRIVSCLVLSALALPGCGRGEIEPAAPKEAAAAPKVSPDAAKLAEAVRRVRVGQSDAIDLRKSPKIVDADLELLRDLPGMRVLNLDNSPITDAGMKEVAGLTSLRSLS